MKVKQLIEELQKFDGELEVYGICDHGQTPEKVCGPSQIWTDRDVHTLWEDYTTHEEEAKEEDYKFKAVLL